MSTNAIKQSMGGIAKKWLTFGTSKVKIPADSTVAPHAASKFLGGSFPDPHPDTPTVAYGPPAPSDPSIPAVEMDHPNNTNLPSPDIQYSATGDLTPLSNGYMPEVSGKILGLSLSAWTVIGIVATVIALFRRK